MESCCRACSRSDDFRRFSLYAVAEVSQEVIANMIRDTSDTQVSTEDGLPQQICPDCLMTLSLAYSFRKQCRRSDAKFREYWGGRTPLPSSVDHQQQQQQQSNQPHQQHPRRSQSQVPPDESSFEAANIKEEVDIYDYEYSVPSSSHDNQWVIQNPRTIGDGPMTVVHNTGGQYYDEAAAAAAAASETSGGALDRDGHGMMHHPMDDPSEMGECSGLGMKGGDKLKKNVPNPERTSQRIRRQMPLEQTASPPTDYAASGFVSCEWDTEATTTSQQMTDALQAVQKGMSFRKAAAFFNVPTGTLFKQATTHRRQPWTNQQMDDALQAVQNGMSFRKAAAFFNVPPGTLYKRATLCGIKKTRPKPTFVIKESKNWTKKQMSNAVKAVKDGMLCREAAFMFGVPMTTLRWYTKRLADKSREEDSLGSDI